MTFLDIASAEKIVKILFFCINNVDPKPEHNVQKNFFSIYFWGGGLFKTYVFLEIYFTVLFLRFFLLKILRKQHIRGNTQKCAQKNFF